MLSNDVDLVDLEIADALQVSPRVTWSVVASALGLSEATVSRRWANLSAHGMAWTSAALHASISIGAFIEIRAKSSAQDEIIESLSLHPDVITVGQTTGDTNIFCIIIATTLDEVLRCINDGLPELALAESVRSSLFHQISGGIDWSQGVMSAATEKRIQKAGETSPQSPPLALTTKDRQLFLALGRDGRMSFSDLGQQLGRTATSARRRVEQLIKSRALVFRADVARPLFDQPIALVLSIKTDPANAKSLAQRLGLWRETRFCASVASAANVILIVGLHDLADAERMSARVVTKYPDVKVVNQKICTRFSKIYGRILDRYGRAVSTIPVDPWFRTLGT